MSLDCITPPGIMPLGLQGIPRVAHQIETWDLSPDQLIDRTMQAAELEIYQGQLVPKNDLERLLKTAITTSTSGAMNALFGMVAVLQFVQQQTAVGILPKPGYPRDGFRAVETPSVASGVGIVEGATSVGTPAIPDFNQITVGLKEIETVTEMTTKGEVFSLKNDSITYSGNLDIVYSNFMNALDVDLLVDMDTLAANNVESLDRVAGSSAENTAVGNDAGDEDLYGVDRSVKTYFDGNALHNAGVDRVLSKSLIDSLLSGQIPFWGNVIDNKVYLTKPDTWSEWSSIEGAQLRLSKESVQVTVNGLKLFPGQAGGFKLNTYDNIPVAWDENMTADTIGRIGLYDLNHVGMVIGRQIGFYESKDMFQVGHNHQAVWYGIVETWADLPASCGKLRDLKTA